QLERLLRKNSDLTSKSNHALDCDDSLGERYPFILKHVNEDGKRCSICPWNRFCNGCSFESNNNEFLHTRGNIAIEWESSAYYLRYLSGREQDVEIHSSVKSFRAGNSNDSNNDEPLSIITLEDCLEAFINWENLDHKEMFNCKRCKKLQPADKKLDIWKLPPCLIFHIKRFQLSNNRWIKSSRSVRFPIRSFHLSKYLPPLSSTTSSFNIETTLNSSIHSSSKLITNVDTVTPSAFTDVTASTVLSTIDTQLTQHSTADNNVMTVSEDHTLSTYETTSKVLPLSTLSSYTYQTLTQIVDTTSSQSSDTNSILSMNSTVTTTESLSQKSTLFFGNIETTTTEHFSSPLLSSEYISTIDITTPPLISVYSSNLITSTTDTSSVQTLTTINEKNPSSTFSSNVSETNEVTTKTSLTTYSSTHINNGAVSTILSQASVSDLNGISTTITVTLPSTLEHISTSTESTLHLTSEYSSKITDELTTTSTTLNDKYQTSITMSSQNSETDTNPIIIQTNGVLSTSL
ncbi:unnamed protein product, partial [Rotaria sp. Silwood2]